MVATNLRDFHGNQVTEFYAEFTDLLIVGVWSKNWRR